MVVINMQHTIVDGGVPMAFATKDGEPVGWFMTSLYYGWAMRELKDPEYKFGEPIIILYKNQEN